MKSRLWLCLLIGLLVLGVLPAAAQDDADHMAMLNAINCLGLSEADCAIVQATPDAELESFNVDFSLSQSTGNADDLAIKGLNDSIDVSGSGTVAIDHSMMSEDNPIGGVSVAMEISGTMTNDDGPNSIDARFVIADGNIYVFQPLTGEYRGTSLADLMEQPHAMPNMSFMGMPLPMDKLMEMGKDGMSGDGEGMHMAMGDFDPEDLAHMEGLLTQARGADETLDGQTMYSFTYTIDLATLLGNEDLQTAITDMATEMTAGSQDAMTSYMMSVLPVVFENTSGAITLTRWIGADDQFVHRVVFDVQAAVDLFGGGTSSTPIPPITLSVNADVTLHDINSATAPVAPEGATLVPAEEFIGVPEPMPEATP